MEKVVTIQYEGKHGDWYDGEAVVEYVEYVEDNSIQREVINVFLPEGISADQHETVKKQAVEEFHLPRRHMRGIYAHHGHE